MAGDGGTESSSGCNNKYTHNDMRYTYNDIISKQYKLLNLVKIKLLLLALENKHGVPIIFKTKTFTSTQ